MLPQLHHELRCFFRALCTGTWPGGRVHSYTVSIIRCICWRLPTKTFVKSSVRTTTSSLPHTPPPPPPGSTRLRSPFVCCLLCRVEAADLYGGWRRGDLRCQAEETAAPALVVAPRAAERPHGTERSRPPQRREGDGWREELRPTGTDVVQCKRGRES